MDQQSTSSSAFDGMDRSRSGYDVTTDHLKLLRFLDERVDRNQDVISPWEQASLQGARILIAGCGSVGGSAVESLTRIGVGGLSLADPEPFDVSNLNRQACAISEVGTNKAVALSDRVLAINPLCDVKVFQSGITEQNLDSAIAGVSLIFDGIDVGAAPVEKYLLHTRACTYGIPVMAGMDFGGKAVLYIFDYRKPGCKPFYGRTTEAAHREHRFADCLTWLGNSHFPADFLPIISDRLVSKKPWPQVAYCVQAMGAIATRCAVEILAGQAVRHVVVVDAHLATMTAPKRAWSRALVLPRLIKALRVSKSSGAQRLAIQEDVRRYSLAEEMVEAIRSAPSPHNCQPWEIETFGDACLRIGLSLDRLIPVVDSSNNGVITSLGCAVEAAAWVADVRITAPEVLAARCELLIEASGVCKDHIWKARSLLARRVTNRFRYSKAELPQSAVDICLNAKSDLDVEIQFSSGIHTELHDIANEGAMRLFHRDDYVSELLEHIRFSHSEETMNRSGMTPRGLGLSWPSAAFLQLLRGQGSLRKLALAGGLSRLMAANAVENIPYSGAFALISIPKETISARIDAGRILMRTWLHLTGAGYACQPIDFTISDDAVRAKTGALFGITCERIPAVVLRIGRPLVTVGRTTMRMSEHALVPAIVGAPHESV
ncbi:ThiF family adenylyltransferase [Xanthomonas sp. 3075]|uniref:ThiF family adenylyltransferase n=1 Tax=Xanthomonas sp. 3075 TaxID=3035315 RepID=UPI00160F4EC6|nr:ThiF family adenylyltransferase [Xanthomonas sp. 3075]MBB4133357.1 hypothetical protein [Xanthomonas sp. 3075]